MKPTVLLSCLLLAFSLSAQTELTKVFELSPNYDLGTRVLPNGNGYAVFGSHGGASLTNGDIFLLRLDQNGNELGRHFFGVSNRSEGIEEGVQPVGNDGWMIAGWQNQGSTRFGYLVRVGANGNVQWSKTLTGNGFFGLYLTCLAVLPSGDYIAAGSVNGTVMTALRFNESGDVLWKTSYNAERAQAIALSEQGGNCFLASRNKVFKIRTSDGQLVWEKPIQMPVFGDPDGDISVDLYDLIPLQNGRFAIAGTALNDQVFSFEQAGYVGLWKENGTALWANAYPVDPSSGQGTASGNSLLYLPNAQQMLLTGENQDGIAVTRIDLNGNALEYSILPTPGACFYPVLNKIQGRYVAIGGDFQGTMNTLFYRSAGNWLPGSNLQPAVERDLAESLVSAVFPNPAQTFLQLEYQSAAAGPISLQVINTLGQIVYMEDQRMEVGTNRIRLSIEHLPNGPYWVQSSDARFLPQRWIKQ